ncbi:MAG TPA: hypothetical protein VEG62_04545 [Acidimicrobiales bacterium]|nr:hypothetical protein [Acidimicrobiales bacterium]
MIDVHFVILGAAIGAVGTWWYLRDTLRGVTRPNRVTWALWTALPLLAFAVEVQAGVGLRALMTFVSGFGPLLVFVASFRNPHATWRIERIDWACGALSLAGLVVWLSAHQATVGLVAFIVADALAALPTLRKSWLAPETETAAAYATAALNGAITMLTVSRWTTAVVSFPLYIVVIASLEALLVGARLGPRRLARRRARPVV